MKFLIILTILGINSFSTLQFSKSTDPMATSVKQQAFRVLQAKCNGCHQIKNKRMVFTIENMDSRAKRIDRQVFKWKRMPKGNDIKLTKEESTLLKNWLQNLSKK